MNDAGGDEDLSPPAPMSDPIMASSDPGQDVVERGRLSSSIPPPKAEESKICGDDRTSESSPGVLDAGSKMGSLIIILN